MENALIPVASQLEASPSNPNLEKSEPIKSVRRYDIDWLRVILFGLLIWFHYAVFSLGILFRDGAYGGDDSLQNIILFFIIDVMHQWRLAALFVISGMGTAFAFKRRTWQIYLKERGTRLLIPLLFTTYIIQVGIFDIFGTTKRFFTIFPGMDGMPYAHLWFVFNLLIYSIILTPLFAHVRSNPDGLIVKNVQKILNMPYGVGILILPPLVLAANGILFKPWHFGEVGMWWEFPRYLIYFAFGYLLIQAKDQYFSVLDRVRIPVSIITPILALVYFFGKESFGIPGIMVGGWYDEGYSAFSVAATIATLLQAFHAWFWCILIFSWASKLLNRSSPVLGYLNDAVYPTYIVHMHITTFVIVFFSILGVNYFFSLIAGTILVTVGVLVMFELVRRASFARMLFGIKQEPKEMKLIKTKKMRIVTGIVSHAVAIFSVLVMIVLWLIIISS